MSELLDFFNAQPFFSFLLRRQYDFCLECAVQFHFCFKLYIGLEPDCSLKGTFMDEFIGFRTKYLNTRCLEESMTCQQFPMLRMALFSGIGLGLGAA